MPDNMNVYEITQMMSNKNNIQRDMTEAMSLVQALFREKYVDRLNQTVQAHHMRAEKQPCREVRLMQALKDFVPEEKKKSLEGMIDTCLMLETIRGMQNELREAQFQSMGLAEPKLDDMSVHLDGVYDVDVACLGNKKNQPMGMAGLFMVLSMALSGTTARS